MNLHEYTPRPLALSIAKLAREEQLLTVDDDATELRVAQRIEVTLQELDAITAARVPA